MSWNEALLKGALLVCRTCIIEGTSSVYDLVSISSNLNNFM